MATRISGGEFVNGVWVTVRETVLRIENEILFSIDLIERKASLKDYVPIGLGQVIDKNDVTEVRPIIQALMTVESVDGQILTSWGVEVRQKLMFPKDDGITPRKGIIVRHL